MSVTGTVWKYRWVVAGIVLGLSIWTILALVLGPSRLPTPWVQLGAIYEVIVYSQTLASQPGSNGSILYDVFYTTMRCLMGAITGAALGVGLGLLLGGSRFVRTFAEWPLEIVRTVPPLAAIPFFLMWFGPTATAQFFAVVFFAALRIVINTVEAIRNVAPEHGQYARTMGANTVSVFRTVVLPAIVPQLVAAFRVVLAAAWGLEVVAEMMGSPAGVGKILNYLVPLLRADLVIAVVAWITIVAVIVDQLVFLPLARRTTRWVPAAA